MDEDEPVKIFPDKPHIWALTRCWELYKGILIPKSRQMTVTWTVCGLYLWHTIFHDYRRTMFQSKKEDDADENLNRAFRIYERLPFFIQNHVKLEKIKCKITASNGSVMHGVPSGPDHARQYTLSGYFSDELVYQERVEDLLGAIKPILKNGGRFTGVSSCGPSYFEDMVFDTY